MPAIRASVVTAVVCAAGLGLPQWAVAADDDDALSLTAAATPEPAKAKGSGLRVFGELAAGRLSRRDGSGDDARRASLDITWQGSLGSGWRAGVSNRLDDMHPVEPGGRSTLNSLREAYAGWQSDGGQLGVDVGRVNLRYGPAYGYNPTDFFREGSARAVTSADPLAQRENRLGTGILRVQQLWDGGSATLALAPKLADAPSDRPFSADFGATNHLHRALLAVSLQAAGNIGLQGFVAHADGRGTQLGASATGLLGDSAVAYVEWAGGRDVDLASTVSGEGPTTVTRQRAAVGVTYTLPSRLAVTLEAQYNGFAARGEQLDAWLAAGDTSAADAYLYEVQRRQDIASRKALMLYLSQRDAFIKNLELTGLLRWNAHDRSRFAWAEARYHLPRADVALQVQGNLGRRVSEYGSQSAKRLVQLMVALYW